MRAMDAQDPLNNIGFLYHFTDVRNLRSIKERGGLYSTAILRLMGITDFIPGGNDWSFEADRLSGMDEYVHLCFKPNHPMEYIAKQEGRIQRSVFLLVEPAVIRLPGVRFSAGVSNKSGVEICDIEQAKGIIDYDVLYKWMDWRDPEIQARRQAAEKCEILVPDHIPIKYLERYFPNGLLPNG